jgi:hypothetical protein
MLPSSSGDPFATYTNIPNYILFYLFEQKRGDLSRTALKLYLYLRSKKNNESGLAWPGVRAIVREAHISKNDVKPARDQLIAADLITISPTKGPRGTILVDFNDETIRNKRSPNGGSPSVPLMGGQGVPLMGEHTITNTITTLTNTNGAGKRKKKGESTRSKSPGAKPTRRIAATPHRGNTPQDTTHLLLLQTTRPTYEDYLRHRGNQWAWHEFLATWDQQHST